MRGESAYRLERRANSAQKTKASRLVGTPLSLGLGTLCLGKSWSLEIVNNRLN